MTGALSKTQWVAFVGFALYFGIFLVQKVVPSLVSSSFLFSLALSLMLIVPLLALLALWAIAAFVISKVRRRQIGPHSAAAGQVAVVGLAAFSVFMVLANVLPSQLPSGSHDRQFDRGAWLDTESTRYVSGDITPRQKMIAEVVEKLPGLDRSEIEEMLGPALDTGYFRSTGRDLIYMTGPERDSFIGIDSEWLLIWLNEDGVYERHAIVMD